MCTRKGATKGLITGGKDGWVMIWDNSIILKRKIDLKEFHLFNSKIMAIAEHPTTEAITIGTRGAEILEI